MTKAATSRGRRIAFTLGAALVMALALFRWAGTDGTPVAAPAATPARSVTRSPPDPLRPAAQQWPVSPPRSAGEQRSPVPQPAGQPAATPPTPSIFDFAALVPPDGTPRDPQPERFGTNEWFTQEDLHHPERYFERAEHMPELNRPEERRDTLQFFLAYQEKLRRDLEAAGDNRDTQEIRATVERYEQAIKRLRDRIEADEGK